MKAEHGHPDPVGVFGGVAYLQVEFFGLGGVGCLRESLGGGVGVAQAAVGGGVGWVGGVAAAGAGAAGQRCHEGEREQQNCVRDARDMLEPPGDNSKLSLGNVCRMIGRFGYSSRRRSCEDYCEREVDELELQGGRVYLHLGARRDEPQR